MAREKNANGTGCIYYDKNAEKWIATIQIGTKENGKPIIKKFTSTKSKKEVQKKLEDFKRKGLVGRYKPTGARLNDYIEMWFDTFYKTRVCPTTYKRQWDTYTKHIKNTIGYLKLNKVKPIDIQNLINSEKDVLSNSTISKTYILLNQVYKYALLHEEVYKNPCLGVVLPTEKTNKVQTKQIEVYTKEELDKMLANLNTHFNERVQMYRASPSFLILANTGMRIGELLGLKWHNVDFDKRLIHVVEQRQECSINGKLTYFESLPKTKTSYRDIPINDICLKMLKELQRRNEVQGLKSNYVVCDSLGNPYAYRRYQFTFDRYCKKYGIRNRGFHTFRHTFASSLFDVGVTYKSISLLLGHASIRETEKTYVHFIKGQELKEIELEKLNLI